MPIKIQTNNIKKAPIARAKKVTKKTSITKKAAVKKTPKKVFKNSTRTLAVAMDEQCFWVCNGMVLADLEELKEALISMSTTTYTYHVSVKKNDFADWVEVVLGDDVCAKELRKKKTVKSASTCIGKYLAAT